jgi:hypothetical protein
LSPQRARRESETKNSRGREAGWHDKAKTKT